MRFLKRKEIEEIFKVVRRDLNNTICQNFWKISRGSFQEDLRKSITKSKREVMQKQEITKEQKI